VITIDSIIDELIFKEGGYTNDPKDSGGETNYGITIAEARRCGYNGLMANLPLVTARKIYFDKYIIKPGFDKVMELSPALTVELVDTGVNMGQGTAITFLQRCLNVLNQQGKLYPDLKTDGGFGAVTLSALQAFIKVRGKDGEAVLLKMLNSLQGARYIELAEAREKDETFVYGWMKNRVSI
jgi:lysozyme family protein